MLQDIYNTDPEGKRLKVVLPVVPRWTTSMLVPLYELCFYKVILNYLFIYLSMALQSFLGP
jgi:hypothetical protein